MGVDDTEVETQEEAPTLRDTLEAAFEESEASAEESHHDRDETEPTATEAPTEGEESATTREDGRDEKGRFKGKESGTQPPTPGKAASTAPVQPKPAEASSTQPPAPGPTEATQAPAPATLKAPASWRADVREKWPGLPEEVRKEVARREYEMKRAMDEGAESRRVADGFRQAVGPYEAMIRAEGAEPTQAVSSLLRTAAALRTAHPQHKAQLLADMAYAYNIPVELLDAALVARAQGRGMPPGQQQQPMQDPRVDQLFARLQQAEAQRGQALNAQTQAEVEEFAQGHEFFDDVRSHMSHLMRAAAEEGQAMGYDEAYDVACYANREVRAALKQREAAKAAQGQAANVARARNASSSVKSQPSGPRNGTSNHPGTLRDTLEAAWEEVEGR